MSLSHPGDNARQSKHTYSNEGLVHMMRLNRGRHCGRACGCLWWRGMTLRIVTRVRGCLWWSLCGCYPWACTACLWIGFAGWLFGGLNLLGPPAISFSEALCVSRLTLLLTPSFMLASVITSMLL